MKSLVDLHPLKLPPLSLMQVSMIKIATCLWNQCDTKNRMKLNMPTTSLTDQRTFSDGPKTVFNSVFEKIDQLPYLPQVQKIDLKFVAAEIGVNAFMWLGRPADDVQLDLVDNLQWDWTGCVDTAQTYRALYFSGKIKQITPTCLKALHEYCLEDCVSDYWWKVLRHHRGAQLQKLYNAQFEAGALLYWAQFVNGLIVDAPVQRSAERVTVAALDGKVRAPYQAFKYFWSKSSDAQRIIITQKLDELEYSKLKLEGLAAGVDGLGFLMERVMEAGRTEFRGKNSGQLEKIGVDVLLHWPWHHVLLSTVEKCRDSIGAGVFYYALARINKQSHMVYQVLGSTQKYHDLTKELWRIAPKSVKLAVASSYKFMRCVMDLLKVSDVGLVKEIFDDEDLSSVRRELFKLARIWWRNVAYNRSVQCVDLDNFVEHVLHSDAEREWFKSNSEREVLVSMDYEMSDEDYEGHTLWLH